VDDYFSNLRQNIAKAQEILTDPKSSAELRELAQAEIDECDAILNPESAKKVTQATTDNLDDRNVIIEIRPAAGGDEAALFAMSLFKMYCAFAASCGFKTDIIDINENEIGGCSLASFLVVGTGAYAKFKYESGVHRVQRVPETETQGRIHTSTCTVAVLPEAVAVNFKIDEKDLRVDVFRASGAGGQHVNRTESAVRLTHIPTNTVVTCQDGRSQIKNREKAMMVLQSKLADYYQTAADKDYAEKRKTQVGTGDRSERIRTYNFPQDRLTDHRINFSAHNLPKIMAGDLTAVVHALEIHIDKI
jgi:peptide chain release factor 1